MSQAAGYRLRLASYPILVTILGAATAAAFSIGSVSLSITSMILWLTIGPFLAGETVRWTGRLLLHGHLPGRPDPLLRLPLLVHFFVSWWTGLLFIYIAAIVLWALGYFAVEVLVVVFAATSGLSALLNLKYIKSDIPMAIGPALKLLREKAGWFVAIATASATIFVFIRAFSPPPFQFGWDTFTHSFISDQVRVNSVFFPLPQQFSDSILSNPYTTIFHALTSVISYLGNGEVILLFWIGPLFNFGVFAAGLAFLSRKAGLPAFVAVGVIVLGLSFHEWHKASSLVYLSPSALITAFTPLVLAIQLAYRDMNRIWSFHFANAGIFLTHFVFGTLLVVVGYAVPIVRRWFSRGVDHRMISAVMIALGSFVILNLTFGSAFYNSLLRPLTDGLASGVLLDRVSFALKFALLTQDWYTLPLIASALAGTFILATRSVFIRRLGPRARLTAATSVVMLAGLVAFLIDLDVTSRILFLARPGLFLLAGFLVMEVSRGFVRRGWSVIAVLLIVFITASAVYPYSSWMNRQRWEGDTQGLATSFADYEQEMGMWIRGNLPQGILLISDPETQRLIEYFGLRSTLFSHAMPREDEALLKGAFVANSPHEASITIRTVVDSRGYDPDQTYLLVSGRTLLWAHSDIRHVFRPRDLSDSGLLQVFAEPSFELVHVVDMQMYLYLVRE